MISATTFARHASVWRQVTPTLEQFVRYANDNQIPTLVSAPLHAEPDRVALIAEVAFQVAASPALLGEVLPILQGPAIEERARTFIEQLPRGAAAANKLDYREWLQVHKLAGSIRSFTSNLEIPQFSPQVPGCGVVASAEADILDQDHLLEVKAVARPFRGVDFRQLLTYASMYYSAGQVIRTVSVFNPRLGYFFSMSLNSVAAGTSGRSRVALLQDVIASMSTLQVSA